MFSCLEDSQDWSSPTLPSVVWLICAFAPGERSITRSALRESHSERQRENKDGGKERTNSVDRSTVSVTVHDVETERKSFSDIAGASLISNRHETFLFFSQSISKSHIKVVSVVDEEGCFLQKLLDGVVVVRAAIGVVLVERLDARGVSQSGISSLSSDFSQPSVKGDFLSEGSFLSVLIIVSSF